MHTTNLKILISPRKSFHVRSYPGPRYGTYTIDSIDPVLSTSHTVITRGLVNHNELTGFNAFVKPLFANVYPGRCTSNNFIHQSQALKISISQLLLEDYCDLTHNDSNSSSNSFSQSQSLNLIG